jgi:N6-adenosine-specific RNA methylase IME4
MPDGSMTAHDLDDLFRWRGEARERVLELPRGMSLKQWREAGQIIGELHRGVGWLVGEWWLYGPWDEADRVATVTADGWSGPALTTCKLAAQCCKTFPKARRRALVPYSHHLEVLSLSTVEADQLLDQAQQKACETGNPPAVRAVRNEVKRRKRKQREQELAGATEAASAELGSKVFGVVYADPPWRFEPYSRDTGMDRAADNHYPTEPVERICAMQVPAADDAVLFLWATTPMLPQALTVMEAWGFTYKSHCVWRKDHDGTGYWFRNRHELLLVGTRGNVPAPAPGEQYSSVIEAALGRHSEKPAAFAEMIEEMFPNVPAVELFARGPRLGWAVWGNEAVSA